MRSLVRAVVVLSSLFFLPVAAFAQGAIAGQVKDASGGVLPGVTVEAASPVLIEKTRTVVSDGSGNYRIENLRPGTYTVTFTLTGFSTIKRDDIEVSGSATTSTDATLRVGAVAETITVTGETPLVDVSSTKKEVVLDHDSIQALPSSRQYFTLARVAPGTTGGGGDVGGAGIADVGQSLTVHGSKAVDQRVMLNGLSIMTLQAGGNIGGQQPDVGSAAEIAVDTTSLSAEMSTGGIRINFIPKDGGNTFGNSTFYTFANQSMQGNNYTDALKNAGLPTPTKIDSTWDLNESIGGPDQERQSVVLVLHAFQPDGGVRRALRECQRVQPERVDVCGRHQQSGRKQGQGAAEQPADHLAGDAEDQDRRRTEDRHLVQLSDLHRRGWRVRTAPPRSRSARLKPPTIAASRVCGRSTSSSRRRSRTGSCSNSWACTCSSAGATWTCARRTTAARSTRRRRPRSRT